MIKRYRKRPVVIEAMQIEANVESLNAALAWIGEHDGKATRAHRSKPERGLIITTEEGEMLATPGDWIIRGVKGEFYPCKPDIFALTYTPDAGRQSLTNAPELSAVAARIEHIAVELRELALEASGQPVPLRWAERAPVAGVRIFETPPRRSDGGIYRVCASGVGCAASLVYPGRIVTIKTGPAPFDINEFFAAAQNHHNEE